MLGSKFCDATIHEKSLRKRGATGNEMPSIFAHSVNLVRDRASDRLSFDASATEDDSGF